MKTLMLLVSLSLVLAPAAVLAAGCADEAAMSCAEGTQWNPETRACETMSS